MKKNGLSRLVLIAILFTLAAALSGCANLKDKFTRKAKEKPKTPIFYPVKKYEVKPSFDLYEKHYVYWINWHKKLIAELGRNYKSDIRCAEEMMENLDAMASMLTDEKAGLLSPHINELAKVRAILVKRNLTTGNETRIRHTLEREYRSIYRAFSPKEVTGYIRAEFKND